MPESPNACLSPLTTKRSAPVLSSTPISTALLPSESIIGRSSTKTRSLANLCNGAGISPNLYKVLISLTAHTSVGETYTEAQHIEGMRRLDIYKQWWLDVVLEVRKRETVVVMGSEEVNPNYRDDAAP